MTYTVSYRDKTGAQREETMDVNSREAVFAMMKLRGISPLAIRKGGHAGRTKLPTGTKRSPYRLALPSPTPGMFFNSSIVIG